MGLSVEQVKRAADVRERLLTSAARLLAKMGVHGITLDAVARDAKVSKGGLLHHFSSKAELLQALMESGYTEFVRSIDQVAAEDDDKYGRYSRAYIKVSLEDEQKHGHATVLMALLLDPSLREDWMTKVESLLQKDITERDPVMTKIVRLAVDGLWLSEAFNLHSLSRSERNEIINRLMDLTRPASRRGKPA